MQRALRMRLIGALGRLRDELDAQAVLETLGDPGDAWAGSGFEDRLRAPLTNVSADDPIAALVLRLLLNLATSAGPGPPGTSVAGLHGWRREPVPDAPRGIAYALRMDPAAGGMAFAVHVTDDGSGPRVGIVASGGQAAAPPELRLGGGWTLAASGHVAGKVELTVDGDGNVTVAAGGPQDTVQVELARADDGTRIGPRPGPGVRPGAIAFGGALTFDAGGHLARRGWLRLTGGSVELVPEGLGSLLRGLWPVPLSIDLSLSDLGATLAGDAQLQARLPVAVSLPGAAMEGLDLVLPFPSAPEVNSVAIDVQARTSVRLSLPGAPVELTFNDLGLHVPFTWDTGRLGFDAPAPLAPTGAGVAVTLPIVRASGGVVERGGQYTGALSASVPPMSASAFGVLKLEPTSFLIMLGATFRPGIEVGFGFAVSGIGGLVGVNRRVDRDGLLRAVTDGTAAELLFPTDPSRSAQRAEAALERIFPPARSHVIAGPMFQVSWGERLVNASVAVIMELAAQPRLTILGKIVVAIPDPAAPLVLLQATFAGQFDPGEPSVLIVASLTGSHVVGVPFDGDLCLLTRGGADATFVLSAGGFHPAFPLPRGVPPLRRIGTDLSTLPLLSLRCEAYLALTTNTIQFGARVELVAEVAGCGLHGHLGFDALIQIDPFHFLIDASIGIAVSVVGEDLVGVRLDLRLEGPAKWHAAGRGSVDLFFFDVPFDFDESWGSAPTLPPTPPDVGALVTAAFGDQGAWTTRRPGSVPPGVVLTEAADHALTAGALVDPYGTVAVRQTVVPLGLRIDRYGRIPLPAAQTWEIEQPRLGADAADGAGALFDRFAGGQYLSLSDDDALGRPAFEDYRSGLMFTGGATRFAETVPYQLDFETKVYAKDVLEPERTSVDLRLSPPALSVLMAIDPREPHWWQAPDARVVVAAATPLAVASTLAREPIALQAGPTIAELRQAIARDPFGELMVVEAYEVSA